MKQKILDKMLEALIVSIPAVVGAMMGFVVAYVRKQTTKLEVVPKKYKGLANKRRWPRK